MNTPKNKPLNRKVEQHKLPLVLPKGNIPTLSELLLPPTPKAKKLKIPIKTILRNKKRKFAKRKVRELKSFKRKVLRKNIPLGKRSLLATKLYNTYSLEKTVAERETYINNLAAKRIQKVLSLAAIIKRINIRKKISPIRTKLGFTRPSKYKSYKTVKLVNPRQIGSFPLSVKTIPLTKYKFKRYLNSKKERYSYLKLQKKKRLTRKVKPKTPKPVVLPQKLYLSYKRFLDYKRKLQTLYSYASKSKSRKKRHQYNKILFNRYYRFKIRLRNKYAHFMLHDKWVKKKKLPNKINLPKKKPPKVELPPPIIQRKFKFPYKSRTVFFGAKAYLNDIKNKPNVEKIITIKKKKLPIKKKKLPVRKKNLTFERKTVSVYLSTKPRLNKLKKAIPITKKMTKINKFTGNLINTNTKKNNRVNKFAVKPNYKATTKQKRRRYKRFLLKVRQSKNNLFVTITNIKSNPYVTLSAGRTAMTGPRRASPFAAELLGRMVGSKLAIYFRKHIGYIILKTHLTKHLRSFFRAISGKFNRFIGIIDFIPRPHGLGLRGRKIRRL